MRLPRTDLAILREDLRTNYRLNDAKYFADKYQVPLGYIYYHASELRLTHNCTWDDQKDNIIKDYLAGDSLKVLADRYGHFKGNVSKRLEKWGVTLRDASEARQFYDLNTKIFANIDSHEKAYWLGFIYADGNVYYGGDRNDKRALQVCLAWKDEEHVERLRTFLGSGAPLYPDRGGMHLIVNNIALVADLARLGVHPRKSLVMTFPSSDQVPAIYRRSFILGYFDGDGTIYSCSNKWNWGIIGTDAFNLGVQKELILAGTSKTSLTREKRSGQGRLSYLTYGGSLSPTKLSHAKHNLPRLFSYLYQDSPVWLPRKRKRFEDCLTSRYPDGWKQFITL